MTPRTISVSQNDPWESLLKGLRGLRMAGDADLPCGQRVGCVAVRGGRREVMTPSKGMMTTADWSTGTRQSADAMILSTEEQGGRLCWAKSKPGGPTMRRRRLGAWCLSLASQAAAVHGDFLFDNLIVRERESVE